MGRTLYTLMALEMKLKSCVPTINVNVNVNKANPSLIKYATEWLIATVIAWSGGR